MSTRKRVAVLISGRGSNMEALLGAASEPSFPAEIVAVISNREDAAGLGLASRRGVEAIAVPHRGHADRQAHEAALSEALAAHAPDIICLAGYMRLLTPDFVAQWQGRMINIHPSLLPAFPGLDTHQRALDAGVRIHGCTVHFVTEKTDEGPIIAQAAVPVLAGDDANSLATRVLLAEHKLYPLGLELVATGKARMSEGRTAFSDPADASAEQRLFSPERQEPVTAVPTDLEHLARFTP
ncbi:phosphoribosylglycinamide formyltransferase [Nitratireductor mangrovi]|uniref:Phosphoribosylglycinamide formyltransferase n=1 Tax=Nitratireductor mangrovi TaxID=2599600 RepID=A0A5B8KZK9_9HYPH|nr:phosphoribosylglycinamide formyltransferase [Nitratireductor mangrovi]QDZ00982.1 phosphoribosylglycinamide formyltransferase [Nitratireductor mangrovi]